MKFNRLSDQTCRVPEPGSNASNNETLLKQALLLATAIFGMIAPTPDSHDIAEITANFIVVTNELLLPSVKAGE
jgi:hypothetical protein